MKKNRRISVFIAKILRHEPEIIGIKLDKHGWANVEELIAGISKTHPEFNRSLLEEIVAEDEKQRYSFNHDKTKIRANQGHSIAVDVELPITEPPEVLYHGTDEKATPFIDADGLLPMTRLYVHMNRDKEAALKSGARHHGKPIIYEIKSGQMWRDNYIFYCSVNGVWLTEHVPTQYLVKMMKY